MQQTFSQHFTGTTHVTLHIAVQLFVKLKNFFLQGLLLLRPLLWSLVVLMIFRTSQTSKLRKHLRWSNECLKHTLENCIADLKVDLEQLTKHFSYLQRSVAYTV